MTLENQKANILPEHDNGDDNNNEDEDHGNIKSQK